MQLLDRLRRHAFGKQLALGFAVELAPFAGLGQHALAGHQVVGHDHAALFHFAGKAHEHAALQLDEVDAAAFEVEFADQRVVVTVLCLGAV